MLSIKNLCASIDDKEILKGLDLEIGTGKVHAIMGPNGSGKSTLASVLAGSETYDVTGGSAKFNGEELLEMDPEDRAALGLFLAFQYPVEIPGVITQNFLKTALNAVRKKNNLEELDPLAFLKLMKSHAAKIGVDEEKLKRALNVGFSGGEKKRLEVLQMSMLQPKLAILDETDSGLDVDAMKTVADGVNALRDENRSFLIITHYRRLLDLIKPDVVHVMWQGRIIETGDLSLADEIDAEGYGQFVSSHTQPVKKSA